MRRTAAILGLLAASVLALFGQAASGTGGSYQVRAIFDNGDFVVPGEDVRIAGAKVGSVASTDVTMPGEPVHRDGRPDPGKAVVVLNIDDPGFQDFRSDASCLIRPQSLLGEKYIDCEPTQPRAPGTKPPPLIAAIPGGQPGADQYLLPLENNGKTVDLDLVQNIQRESFADRFRLILNNLGIGLAGRGQDLNAIIKRADPALRQTDEVLAILARQNHALASLASDSDRILSPLARERAHIGGFIANANQTAQATAERGAALETGLQRLPSTLHQLRLTMVKLRGLADQATPVTADLGAAAPSLARATQALGPFASSADGALVSLGSAAQQSTEPIVKSDPVIRDLRDLAKASAGGAVNLDKLLASFRKTGGINRLMEFIYFGGGALNGFDSFDHFLRGLLLVTNCTDYVTRPLSGCVANFSHSSGASAPLDATGQPESGAGLAPGASQAAPRHPGVSLGQARRLLDVAVGADGGGQKGSGQ